MHTEDTHAETGDDKILKEMREFVDHAVSSDSDNRNNARSDLTFLKGDQWPQNVKAQREADGRPCLTFNRLPTFIRQVTNDQRQNKAGIKVHPVGGDTDLEDAKVFQGVIRHIEYSSNADIAYDTAVNSAASIGWGFWRLVTEYESPTSFNQVIKFKRERDAMKVFFDPNSVEADGSDQKRCAVVWDMAKADFRREHPGVDIPTGSQIGQEVQPAWMNDQYVRVVEFYYFEHKKETLYLLADGTTTTDKPPAGVATVNERETMVPQLKWVKAVGGTKVLEKTKIMCKWIPVFPVWGNEIDIEGKVERSGIVRDAKDPAQMYNFWMTSATEEVSSRTKAPWIGAAGQFEGFEKQWGMANKKPMSFLEYNPVEINGSLAPPPQRQHMADVPVGMIQMAVHAADNIKAVTGLFDSSLGAHGGATSGIQEREQQRQGDNANFHYTDNLNRSIRHCGRCLVDMIPHYYDGQRVVSILNDDDTISAAEINKPMTTPDGQPVDAKGQPITDPLTQVQGILNDLTVGTYGVTISAGPSYATQRQESAEAMQKLATAWPELLPIAGDLIVAGMDWPDAEKLAARVKKSIPPQLTADEDKEEGGPPPLPPEIEQHIQQADQLIDQLQQQLQEATAGHQADIEKAKLDAASREEIARINAASAANVAEINAGALMDKEELISLRAQLAHHQRLVENDQKADHQHAASEQSAEQQHEAGEQSHEQALEQSRLAASQAAAQAQSGPTDAKSGS
jgi:hypothetical protein